MKTNLKQINGVWDQGWALDKHMSKSTFVGYSEHGHPKFDSVRTEVGEAVYQLKFQEDWNRVMPLAQALADFAYPNLQDIGLIIPMPATKMRVRQPVLEVANCLGRLGDRPVFPHILLKAPNGKPLKDLATKAEKVAAIGDSLSIANGIQNEGRWNVLLIDDLFHTGASMEAACKALRTYPKVNKIYVAALTWR
jgi:predicted amidophosphoribosyltransferase